MIHHKFHLNTSSFKYGLFRNKGNQEKKKKEIKVTKTLPK